MQIRDAVRHESGPHDPDVDWTLPCSSLAFSTIRALSAL